MGQYTSGTLVYGMICGEFSCPDEYLTSIYPEYEKYFESMLPGNGYGENYIIYWKASHKPGAYEDEFVPIDIPPALTEREESEFMAAKMESLKANLEFLQKHDEDDGVFGFVSDPMCVIYG